MSPDPTRLSRRKVLTAVGSVGAVGAVAGAGTAAYLGDRERFTGAMAAGGVAVEADCDSCSVDRGRVRFAFEGIEPGDEASERFELRIPDDGNRARLWLRTDCPPAVDPLGEALEVRLVTDEGCTGADGAATLRAYDSDWTTLNGLRTALAGGLRLDDPDDPCLSPGEVACLRLQYRLPADATWAVAAESDLAFEFHAEQCRHVPESAVEDGPFGHPRCPESDCPDCVELGTLDVEDGRLIPGETYPLGDGYELQVLSATDKDDDGDRETVCVSFRLLKDGEEDAAPPICRVDVGGGRPQGAGSTGGRGDRGGSGVPGETPRRGPPEPSDDPHPSDPESRVVTYQVEPPLTRTRGGVCAAHGDDHGSVPDGERPGISNLTVFVCADDGTDPEEDPDCVPCRDDNGNRVGGATFEYHGPADGVTVVVDQRGSGDSPAETVRVDGIDDGDAFEVPLGGSGRPDFDVAVEEDGSEVDVGTFHTSCSEPFGPGLVIAGGGYELTVLEAVTKDGIPICEEEIT